MDNKITVNKKTKKGKKVRYVLIALLVMFILILGIFALTLGRVLNVLETKPGEDSSTLSNFKEIVTPLNKKVNILILGSDISYDGKGQVAEGPTRSDTMILAQIDPKESEVRALSIPRDTRVFIPGRRYYDKINAAYSIGGEELARETVSHLTGIQVDHYVKLKVEGLVNLVDIIGGIDIYVDKDMKYTDNTAKLNIDLKKGWQHLDGEQAHGYVRFRYDENGDIGRVQRQQKFIQAVAAKLVNPINFLKIPEMAAEAQKNIESDLSDTELLKIGYFVRKLNKDQVRMVMLPGDFKTIGGVSYWSVSDYIARNVITELFPESEYAISKDADNGVKDENTVRRERRRYRVTIRNATEDKSITRVISAKLKEDGWSVISTSKSMDVNDKTQLIVQTGINSQVSPLKDSLGIPVEVVNASTGDLYADYTIVIGKDLIEANNKKVEQVD